MKERLIQFLAYLGIGQNKFEEKVGLSIGYINKLKGDMTLKSIKKITDTYLELNEEWLKTGKGRMLKNGVDIVQDEINYVPLLPISAQGGTLNDFIVSVKDSDCEKIISPVKGADWAVTVSGDSMSPEYPSGAQILIKKINEKAFIDWGRVYVLDTCNGTVIKILTPSEKDGYVKCVSINTDPKYASFDVSIDDIYGIYRVMLCMSVK
ncbi:MAG: helix-turn-helix transcriptional regulator [Candidatus Symbiothrix sp.]|jgi:phage repressor protein C with HTH and peptisase S24 domain|nr:helix-turn-helix transcriptional regulator [Candidatus Symbiothrix sp.]